MDQLLVTNICFYIIKKKPLEVFELFSSKEIGTIGISTITVAKLQYGVSKSSFLERNLMALNNFLLPFIIVNFDLGLSEVYGKIRSDLEKKGRPIGSMDLLIAAQAISLNITLVTNNTKELDRISGIKIENWVK